MARNRYDEDEVLETPFDFNHLKRAFKYIKKYKTKSPWHIFSTRGIPLIYYQRNKSIDSLSFLF